MRRSSAQVKPRATRILTMTCAGIQDRQSQPGRKAFRARCHQGPIERGYLGGGFKYVLVISLPGEMLH